MKNLTAAILGIVFGIGLGVSGMTDPAKVTAFLDIAGDWDPSLLLVMGAAVGINFFAFRAILRRKEPKFDASFHMPRQTRIDPSLIIGSMLFGIGWGLSGFCPGAAVSALSSGAPSVFLFLATMAGGMQLHDRGWVAFAERTRAASQSIESGVATALTDKL